MTRAAMRSQQQQLKPPNSAWTSDNRQMAGVLPPFAICSGGRRPFARQERMSTGVAPKPGACGRTARARTKFREGASPDHFEPASMQFSHVQSAMSELL